MMIFKNKYFFMMTICLSLVSAVSFSKKDNVSSIDLPALEKDVEDLKTTSTEQGKSVATMLNQVNEMVGMFQNMNGNIGKNEKKNTDQDKAIEDLATRLQTLEDQISVLTNQMQELQKEGFLKPKAAKKVDEYLEYAKSLELINSRNYKKAITGLEQFQNTNKKSIYTSYAQYWIGESYYLQSDYPMAIKQYNQLLKSSPSSNKAPYAMYKISVAFMQMQYFDDAKNWFNKVIRTYPGTHHASLAGSQIYRINEILAARKQSEIEQESVEY